MGVNATTLIRSPATIHIQPLRRPHATRPRRAPTLRVRVVANANADAESAVLAPGTPGPAGASADGQVVPSEREPGGADADQRAGDQVEAEVVEFDKARRADVDGDGDGDAGEDDQVGWGRGGLVAGWDGAWAEFGGG